MNDWRMFAVLVFSLLGAWVSSPAAGDTPKTIAVLDFAQRHAARETTASHRWLSKALSDLIIGDLAVAPNLRVVTREHMHMLMQEAELRERSGLTEDRLDPEALLRMRQYVKVDHLLLGTFAIQAEAIRIEAHLVASESGDILARFSQDGVLADALTLEKALARQLLEFLCDGKRAADSWVMPVWTDSMEASEWLYMGVDAFDAGQYNHAWYAFRRALRADPAYADAVYWCGRMYYFRQDYAHAHVVYRDFIRRFPGHARIGDAVAEYIHSRECGALSALPIVDSKRAASSLLPAPEFVSLTPEQALAFYRTLRARDWGGAFVHNKVDYASRSPLSDWLLKREQQALAYMDRFDEAFILLETGLRSMADDPQDAAAQSWRDETKRLMGILAMESEDAAGPRLSSEFLEARDFALTTNHPVAEEDLSHSRLKGAQYVWGTNWRILAPPRTTIKSLKATIRQTVDPGQSSTCRLQIRRYRYVDIDGCSFSGKGEPLSREQHKTVQMPYGLTWFYLRPEYYGLPKAEKASFDGWRVEAELEPIPADSGLLDVRVENAHEYNTYINDVFTRCYDGRIPHLAPGTYTVSFGPMWRSRKWAFDQSKHEVEVQPGQTTMLNVRLRLNDETRARGWDDPCAIASSYPTFKHRPRPDSNWRSGPPAIAIHPQTGEFVAIWSHLDDLWFSRSADGKIWDEPATLPPPVNSADSELNPRLLIDHDGRYCLLLLSNRGLFRNLASYVSWSSNLREWARPILLSPQHHDDHDLIQDNQGRYLLLLTPAPSSSDGSQSQDALISLRASRDLVEWTSPVAGEEWRAVFLRDLGEPSHKDYLRYYRPWKARIVQDGHGMFHLIWSSRLPGYLRYRCSADLVNWSPAEHIRNTITRQPYDLTLTVDDEQLLAGLISSDEFYSGYEVFGLSATPLQRDQTMTVWHPLEVPALVVNGMPDLAYHRGRRRWVVAWQIAEHALHASRRSGPVFCMQGYPGRQPGKPPPRFQAKHNRVADALHPLIDRLQQGGTLTQAELAEARTLWKDYIADLDASLFRTTMVTDWQKRLKTTDYAAYYLNACRISVIDPQWYGVRIMSNDVAYSSFSTIMDLLATGDEKPEWLAALVISGANQDSLGDSLRAYHRLNAIAPFWAEHLREIMQVYVDNQMRRGQRLTVRAAAVNELLQTVGRK